MPTLGENSRVIFTNNFKEKTMAKISKRKMGELRWEKLKQAERDGSLQGVRTRRQLGELVGINDSVPKEDIDDYLTEHWNDIKFDEPELDYAGTDFDRVEI